MTIPRLIFLDTETTGLDRRHRQIWDLAYIVRDPGEPDREFQEFLPVDLSTADPFALGVGGYYRRHPNPYGEHWGNLVAEPKQLAIQVAQDFQDAILVGAVPSFDEESLAYLLFDHNLQPTWHYHLVDVETLVAGKLGLPPKWDFDKILASMGLVYDETDRHTAIGDARMARDVYDKVMQP